MSDETPKSLWAAVLEAQRNIGAVKKDKTAKVRTKSGAEYEYKFASTEDMMAAARGALLTAGLVAQRISYEVRHGGAGAEVWSTFRIVHPESGESEVFEPSPMPISGVGAGDKALAGALTYGWSYWLRDVLAIPREDENAPDRRKTDDGAPRWGTQPPRESSRKVTPAPQQEAEPVASDEWKAAYAEYQKAIKRRSKTIEQLGLTDQPKAGAIICRALGVNRQPRGRDISPEQWGVITRAVRDDIDDIELTADMEKMESVAEVFDGKVEGPEAAE